MFSALEMCFQDPQGLSDTATVTIAVEDYDNLNPYFHHSLYKASIDENQVKDVKVQDLYLKCISAQTN